jgi:hypothetical protein
MRKLLALVVALLVVSDPFATYANGQEILRTDVINVFFDPDTPLPAGQTFKSYYESKKFVYVYREIIPTEVGGNTYFAILGANGGYPDFYGGIQYFKDQFISFITIFPGKCRKIFHCWSLDFLITIFFKYCTDGIENMIPLHHFNS